MAEADTPDEQQSAPKPSPITTGPHRNVFQRLLGAYWRRKLWTLPLTLVVLAGIVMAVPQTRYPVLALGIKRTFSVTVTDSTAHTPVSGATISLDGHSITTDGSGKAKLTARVGARTLAVDKKYYRSVDQNVFVGLGTHGNTVDIALVATGRQVPLKVVDKITGKPISAATIKFLDTNAVTDASGQAQIVVPVSESPQSVTVSADGYNSLTSPLPAATPSSGTPAAFTVGLVLTGRVYFLSNLSGKIDVVSTNLDGSGRQTVVAGTGSEDSNDTVLLASRDWKFLALVSKRDGNSPKLYLVNADTKKLSTIDGATGVVTPIGWSDHYFVYQVSDPNAPAWQSGAVMLKSYNADTGATVTLVSTKATGTSNADAQYQAIWDTVFLGGNLVYTTTWYSYPGYLSVNGQQDTLVSIKPDGTGNKTLKSVDAGQYYFSNLKLATPAQAYIGVYSSTSSAANYYRVDANGSVSQSSTITSDAVTKDYPTYLLSPGGTSTFWSELRDGKNTLFVGDANGSNGAQVGTLSDYKPYGWFTDRYLLVQKGGSELYIMPATGGTPLKVSDYYRPQYSFQGYGGTYGGL